MARGKRRKKIGRNDPCPCGSGKKYKYCCLLKGRTEEYAVEIPFVDPTSLRMHYLSQRMQGDFVKTYQRSAQDIEAEVFSRLPLNCVLDKNKSENVLLRWKTRLEEEIAKLCSSHSKYYWLFLSRHIFPATPYPHDRPGTPYLHRTTFNLALLKYGSAEQSGEFVNVPARFDIGEYIESEGPYSGETIDDETMLMTEPCNVDEANYVPRAIRVPRHLTLNDVIDIYKIEYLSYNYYMVTAQLRRVWKGGKLRVKGKQFDEIILPEKVEVLVSLFDKRNEQYGGLLSHFGLMQSLETAADVPDDFVIFVPIWNIEKHKVPLVFPGEEFIDGKLKGPVYLEPDGSNFVPLPTTLQPLYEKACMFREAIEGIFGFSPEEIITFLIALERHHQSFWLRIFHSRYNFFQRGYSLQPSTQHFQEYLLELYQYAHRRLFGDISAEGAASSLERLVEWAAYSDEDFSNISLWERTGVRLLLRVPGGLLVDHSAIPAVLTSIFSELSLLASSNGRIGQVKGDDFENEVEKYLEANVPNFRHWICHKQLEFGSGAKRDIDVSFRLGQVLFVIECKSFSRSLAFERGEPDALKSREEKTEAALNQVDSLCELLSKESKGRNFEIPRGVTRLVAIAASPFPEYIAVKSERYFLTNDIPRVCTPQEIAEFSRSFDLTAYISKPFVWEAS